MGETYAQDARSLARWVLQRVRRDQAFANLALSGALDRARELKAADRGLATELVYGVLRHRRLIDHVLSLHARQPLQRMDAEVLDVLRVAVFQLFWLGRGPVHAAVHEAVDAARRLRGDRVAAFVNAVLRHVRAEDRDRELPPDGPQRLAVQYSVPDDVAERWTRQLGLDEARRLAEAQLERAPFTVRCNSPRFTVEAVESRLAAEGAQVTRGMYSPLALQVRGLEQPFRSRSFLDGAWTVQDEAAQLAAPLLDPQAGERILDACAGVGGKATQLAAVGPSVRVIAADSSERKLEVLADHCHRLGLRCDARCVDLTAPQPLADGPVDRVLLDAPCSGLGVLRRHPELKWRWDPASLRGLVRLQRELLRAVFRLLRPGGVLVYSVCTTTEEEGPDQMAWFLDGAGGAAEPLPPRGAPWESGLCDGPWVRLWPHRHGTDGFFLARLRKTREGAVNLQAE